MKKNLLLEFPEIKEKFKSRHEHLVKAFGRVEDFKELSEEHRNWTFWTYAQRAAKVFSPIGSPILRQLKGHRKKILKKADMALERAFSKMRSDLKQSS